MTTTKNDGPDDFITQEQVVEALVEARKIMNKDNWEDIRKSILDLLEESNEQLQEKLEKLKP